MAARKPAKPAAKAPARKASPPEPAAPPPQDHDYLVIYEEPDPDGLPADDVLVLDIETHQQTRGEVDVQQKVDLELANTTSRLGTVGFATTILGALAGIATLVTFAYVYPDRYYLATGVDNGAVRLIVVMATVSLLLLVVGTILTHYGRRIRARGKLSDVRIVEKSPQAKLSFD
ncbi:MAG: hypothetical protein QOD77_1460 [Thermoplasmata archaeon]|jgi:hypothetical protein|nr:hypothetical protein [Thermoplasmata archaeon]